MTGAGSDDWLFAAFLIVMALGPLAAALAWSAWWLLAYVPVMLIMGL